MPIATINRLRISTMMSFFPMGLALYQVLVLFFPNRLNSIAWEMVSIRSRLSKIRGMTIFELALILFIRLAFPLISIPLAWLACLMSKYDFWISGIYLKARATAYEIL